MRFNFVSFAAIMAYIATAVSASSIFRMNVKDKLTPDFLTGFESGIFMRNGQQQFDEYGCPESHADSRELGEITKLIPNLRDMTKLINGGKEDPLLNEILETMELFIGSFDKFIGVFDQDYSGGDFCAGLTFGMQGTKLLEKVATTLYQTHLKNLAKDARSH